LGSVGIPVPGAGAGILSDVEAQEKKNRTGKTRKVLNICFVCKNKVKCSPLP
jgi:hypothetical protein